MSQITQPLYADYVNRKLVTVDGSTLTLPTFTLGDTLLCPLHLMERTDSSSALVEGDYAVRSLRASIGPTLAAPTGGGWNLQLEDPENPGEFWTSDSLDLAVDIGDLQTALEALFVHVSVSLDTPVLAAPSCWIFSTDGEDSFNLMGGVLNTLDPVSFVRVRPYQQGTKWWYEIRLIQSPLAFCNGFDRILPDPPSITRIQAGAAATGTGPAQDELQDLYIPPDFKGTYFFRFDFRRSVNVGYQDGQDVVQAALNGMFGDSVQRFNITTPEDNHGQIDFMGPLGGAPQNLLDVEVFSNPEGVITFTLPLDRAEMASALRAVGTITVPLEIDIEVVDNPADIDNLDVAGRIITLCQIPVIIQRDGIWKEMAVVEQIDFQRPTSPRTYLPWNSSQLLPGQIHYPAIIGDGEATAITIDHNLGTNLLAGVFVFGNVAGGKVLTQNDDYQVTIDSANSVTLTFAVAPAEDALNVIITAAPPVSTFIGDLHIAIGQVDGLQDLLNTLAAGIAALNALIPKGVLPSSSSSSGDAQDLPIPDTYFAYPNGRLGSAFDASTLTQASAATLAALPRPPALMPAIHNATITDFSTGTLPTDPTKGNVYRNTNADPVTVLGGGGRRPSTIATGEFAGFDGRYWYPLTRAGSTNSYFPRDFELQLFAEIDMSDAMWSAGQALSLEFDLDVRVLRATASAQYLLVIEYGQANSQTDPAATATNLKNLTWANVPLLTQRLVLSSLPQKRHFGCQILRNTDGTMTAQKLLQKAWTPADACPLTPTFLLRARLIQFDTEKSVAGVGYVYASITSATASIQ